MRDVDSFWEKLGPADQSALERNAVTRRFSPGDFLFRQGDQSKHVFILRSGHVRVLAGGADGREVVLAVRFPGAIIGDLAALDDGPRSATLQALDAVTAMSIPGPQFAALCQSRAQVAWTLLRVIASRLRDTGKQWVEFGGGSASQRVIALLLELAVRHGKPSDAGIEIATPATQDELAATASTSRESLARVLRDLRNQGLVSTGRKRITVHHIDALRQLLA